MCEMFKDEFFLILKILWIRQIWKFSSPKKPVKLKGDLHGFAILAKFLSKAQDDGKEQMRCALVEGGKKKSETLLCGIMGI